MEEYEELVDDNSQLKSQNNDSDWVAQDRFAQGEKSFVLTMSEADEVKPHTGEDMVRTTKCDCKGFHRLGNQIQSM
ncbi:hypothetical protein AMTRI_Chr11g155960 [Amborella trichopoda]